MKVSVVRKVIGAVLCVEVTCGSCGYKYEKSSSPLAKGRKIHELNYILSCAILFGGALAEKSLRYVYDIMAVQTTSFILVGTTINSYMFLLAETQARSFCIILPSTNSTAFNT